MTLIHRLMLIDSDHDDEDGDGVDCNDDNGDDNDAKATDRAGSDENKEAGLKDGTAGGGLCYCIMWGADLF